MKVERTSPREFGAKTKAAVHSLVNGGGPISLVLNRNKVKTGPGIPELDLFSPEIARKAWKFHRTVPGYGPTPLIRLRNFASRLGLGAVFLKDESHRFGLNAFKPLGASYAMADLIARHTNQNLDDLTFETLQAQKNQRTFAALTVVTATDGNHGKALAWTASHLGCRAVIYIPEGSSPARIEAIRQFGAVVEEIDGNYNDALHLAAEQAQKNGWCLVQDAAFSHRETSPVRIMQGYLTMICEALDQMEGEPPTHLFLQTGVGAFSGAIQAYLVSRWGADRPRVVIVEPSGCACFYQSMVAGGEEPQTLDHVDTIMSGLACGEPSLMSWQILRTYSDAFAACDDEVSVLGLRLLARPFGDDPPVISGESGSVTAGLLYRMLSVPGTPWAKDLGLNSDSRVLLFSTEGDTDPEKYQRLLKAENSSVHS